jgi:hypothetical protein
MHYRKMPSTFETNNHALLLRDAQNFLRSEDNQALQRKTQDEEEEGEEQWDEGEVGGDMPSRRLSMRRSHPPKRLVCHTHHAPTLITPTWRDIHRGTNARCRLTTPGPAC